MRVTSSSEAISASTPALLASRRWRQYTAKNSVSSRCVSGFSRPDVEKSTKALENARSAIPSPAPAADPAILHVNRMTVASENSTDSARDDT